MNFRASILLMATFFVGCATSKSAGAGVSVKVFVLDNAGAPIATAVVRHPQEADRHRVNAATGHWEGSVLYLPDGSELIFQPNTSLQLEVSAPGYLTKLIQYDIKKRRNQFDVRLDAMDLKEADFEEPIIQFGRDRKKSDIGGGAAN
jgi:hypothetical protein